MRFFKTAWDAVNACPIADVDAFNTTTLQLTEGPAVIDSTAEEMSKVTSKHCGWQHYFNL
jgi:hypothetical protein